MKKILNDKEYLELVQKLNRYAEEYYTFDKSSISDSEYDELYKQLQLYEKTFPLFVSPDSPTQRVGDKVLDKFEKAKHITPLYSLENVFDFPELQNWLKTSSEALFCEMKYDGASLNLIYRKGELVQAITRGNGKVGEDVTQNSRKIPSIPEKIDHLEEIEIRGEVIIFREDFEQLNREKTYSNPRNLASGSLRQLNPKVTERRRLNFIPHGIGKNSLNFSTQKEVMEFLHSLGFLKIGENFLTSSIDEVWDFYLKVLENRENERVEIDGVVVKMNSLKTQEKLGFGIKTPKWAVAIKFPSAVAVSKLNNIIWQVGRTGTITPVAEVEPVEVGGVIVKRVTLHNLEEIERLKIGIGSEISIARRGDVIPKIESAKEGEPIVFPDKCPSCQSQTVREKGFLKCQNPNCDEVLIRSIDHFLKTLEVQEVGEETIRVLVKENLIKKLEDIFQLEISEMVKIRGFGEKKSKTIVNSINSIIGNRELSKFISALGIDGVGDVNSREIAENFGFEFLHKNATDFQSLSNFGEKTANNIALYISKNREKVEKLLEIIQPTLPKKEEKVVVAITGTLSMPRKEIIQLIEEQGWIFSSSVSKKVDILIVGEKAGSKKAKAEKLKIPIYSENQFLNLLNN